MIRYMIDCTSANTATVHDLFPTHNMIAVYVTGTPDIMWSAVDRTLWPNATQVTIDQGGLHSPVFTAMVRDVESRAWTVSRAVDKVGWKTPRPTIYCSRDTIPSLIAAGWRGDVWVAWPDYALDTPPEYPGLNVVAVQDIYRDTYDISTVFDSTWPYVATKEEEMLYVAVQPMGSRYIPFPDGSFKGAIVYRDFLSTIHAAKVRVAAHSHSAGYTVHEVLLDSNGPVSVTFPHPDTDAVSIENDSSMYDVGVTLA